MVELLWLLLPIAAASGWIAARRSGDGRGSSGGQVSHDPAYFKGLNYLLNEQPDKAIDVFVEMLEVDSETVETHLALGSLFRRRGEVDRAIRIHQNLIARPTLSRDQRTQALLELGQDYMRAGLFDRAENLFGELVEMGSLQQPALRNLRVIYEQEKEWDRCLEVAIKLEKLSGESLAVESAHYHCELAEIELGSKNHDQVALHLKRALGRDPNCVRATILQAEMEASRSNCKLAIKSYKRVEIQNPDFLSEILPSMAGCYRQLGGRQELVNYLQQLVDQKQGIAPVLALIEFIQSDKGDQAALDLLTTTVQKQPSLDGVDRLITLNLKRADGAEAETLRLLQEVIEKLRNQQPTYQCSKCGFTAKTLHWHCPSCKAWSSIKPVNII
ncbi:MAG: lipopolysaccharide assembly protein LapB [Gammaproteobacteria bacterium]|nr:lipopolysaccharide assembly protein LapB [Gammaproteobacteria bacterium]